jgi:hypothetical protein
MNTAAPRQVVAEDKAMREERKTVEKGKTAEG